MRLTLTDRRDSHLFTVYISTYRHTEDTDRLTEETDTDRQTDN